MNDYFVDFSKTDIRKLAYSLTNINFNLPPVPESIKPKKELPHELRKALTILKILQNTNRYSEEELAPLKTRIKNLENHYSK